MESRYINEDCNILMSMSITLTKELHERFRHSNRVYIEVPQCKLSCVCWAPPCHWFKSHLAICHELPWNWCEIGPELYLFINYGWKHYDAKCEQDGYIGILSKYLIRERSCWEKMVDLRYLEFVTKSAWQGQVAT